MMNDALADYIKTCKSTAIYRECCPTTLDRVVYCALGLGEAGEAQGKLKKVLRGDASLAQSRQAILEELGDTLWYITMMAEELDSNLAEVMGINAAKLLSRKERGTLQGSGDDR
jgi:NTP pyrophosphatase (non-canonical NTP hydrolase)